MSESRTIYLKPNRKIVGAAIAALVVGGAQQIWGFDLFAGGEAALAVLVGYLIPNK
jgi:hypothetical protein